MQRVKWTAEKFYYDKYHGPIHQGTEIAILQRSQPWGKWYIEASDMPRKISGDLWDEEWCPIRPGKTYTGPASREITVEILKEKVKIATACDLTIDIFTREENTFIERLAVSIKRKDLFHPWLIASSEGFLYKKQGETFDDIGFIAGYRVHFIPGEQINVGWDLEYTKTAIVDCKITEQK